MNDKNAPRKAKQFAKNLLNNPTFKSLANHQMWTAYYIGETAWESRSDITKKKAKRQEERLGKEGAHKFRSDAIKKGKKRQEERLGEEGAHKLRSDAAKKGQARRKVKSMHDPKSLENRRKNTK